MKRTEVIMGMPITVEVADSNYVGEIEKTFAYFRSVDERYSTYKPHSEISQINHGLPRRKWSKEMRHVLDLCEETKLETHGYFDIVRADGSIDPSGLVKGWAIDNAAQRLARAGVAQFYIEAGGDIQTHGMHATGRPWRVGIRNPFKVDEIVKTVGLSGQAIATSGTYIRGQHIYNPRAGHATQADIASLTVIGPNIYDADRYATAAYAMGKEGIVFIAELPGFECYLIDTAGKATFTPGFTEYTVHV